MKTFRRSLSRVLARAAARINPDAMPPKITTRPAWAGPGLTSVTVSTSGIRIEDFAGGLPPATTR